MSDYNSIVDPHIPYTHERLLMDVGKLCDRYPKLVGITAVGLSEQHREIPVVCVGFGEKKTLAVGALHGREYVTVGFLLRCIEEYAEAFCKNYLYSGYDIKAVLREYTLHILPMSNPDGVEIALGRSQPSVQVESFDSGTYKNNANNVNLNANFPYMWERVPKCRQGGKAQERETRFLIELCTQNNYEKMLSFHCRGDCLYWRDEGNGKVYGDEEVAQRLCSRCGYAICPPTDKAEDYSGGFENWFRNEFNRCGICVELIRYEEASFDLCCRYFEEYTRWEQTRGTILAAV